jgi:hypothetical protein
MSDQPELVTFEEAVKIADEIGRTLGGRKQRALQVLVRLASKAHRPSSTAMKAVDHFRTAAEIAKGSGGGSSGA